MIGCERLGVAEAVLGLMLSVGEFHPAELRPMEASAWQPKRICA